MHQPQTYHRTYAALIRIVDPISPTRRSSDLEKAYLASMKSDLRNLVTAEEAYFADSVKYTTNLGTAYATTSGVGVAPGQPMTITLTADGWQATVGHSTTTKQCAIYVGSTTTTWATKEGEPKCK